MLVQVGGIVTFDTRALVMKVAMSFTTNCDRCQRHSLHAEIRVLLPTKDL